MKNFFKYSVPLATKEDIIMSHVYFQLLQDLSLVDNYICGLSVFRKIICKFLHPHDSESSPVLYLSDIKIQLIPVPHFTE